MRQTAPVARPWRYLTALVVASLAVASGVVSIEFGPFSPVSAANAATSTATSVARLGGADRYGTAVAASEAKFPSGAPIVFLANGLAFPDALSASAAAAYKGGPLLLTTPASLPASTSAEITRLKPSTVVVVGGTGVVSDAVVTQIQKLGVKTVRRDAGADRFATSRAVAQNEFPKGTTLAYVADGMNFPDALSASGPAGANKAPVVLVNGAAKSADSATVAALTGLGVKRVYVAGGTAAVSAGIQSTLSGAFTVTRAGGPDRYATSALLAATATYSSTAVVIATGADFADGLVAGAYAGGQSPVVLSQTTCIPTPVVSTVESYSSMVLIGGTGALSSQLAAGAICGGGEVKLVSSSSGAGTWSGSGSSTGSSTPTSPAAPAPTESTLSTASTGTIELPSFPPSDNGALIRVSVSGATKDTHVFAAGTPALTIPAGSSASTTVLVPVTTTGVVALYADNAVTANVSILATFDGEASAPGSTIALATPKNRTNASSATSFDGDAVGSAGETVGLVGLGGVPATGVRAEYVTATVTVPASGQLTIAGQQMTVPTGVTSITTAVTPDADGAMQVSYTASSDSSATATVRVDVRGWVPEAPQGAAQANTVNSYVPTALESAVNVSVGSSSPATLSSPLSTDSVSGLVLLAADPASKPSTVDVGRAAIANSGAVDDPGAGAIPQLAVATVSNGRTQVYGSQALSAYVTWLGGFLGSSAPAGSAPTITITSPTAGSSIDLASDHGFHMTGTVSSAAAVDHIEIDADGQSIGTARLVYGSDRVTWAYDSSAAGGSHTLTATVVDRAGKSASASVQLDFTVPAATDTVVAPNTVVVPSETAAGNPVVESVSADQIVFNAQPSFAPGNVIVSGVAPNAPEGFLRTVDAVDQVGDTWVVTTSNATLTDAIWQADVDQTTPLMDQGTTTITPNMTPADGFQQVDEGQAAVQVLTGDAVDLSPDANTPDADSTVDQPVTEPAASASQSTSQASSVAVAALFKKSSGSAVAPLALSSSLPQAKAASSDSGTTLTQSLSLTASVVWQGSNDDPDKKPQDLSKATAATQSDAEKQVQVTGGLMLSGQAQAGVSLHFALKVSFHWAFVVPIPTVDNFTVEAETVAKATASVNANIEASFDKSYDNPLGTIGLPTLTIPIGPVPVVITSSLEAYLDADISLTGTADLTINMGVQRTQTYGFTYSTSGGFQSLNSSTTTYKSPEMGQNGNGVTISLDADASFGPRIEYDISIYDAAGPTFSVGLKGGISADLTYTNTTTPASLSASLDIYLQVDASGGVELKVPIIDAVLVSKTLITISKKFDLASWSWTPDGGATQTATGGGADGSGGCQVGTSQGTGSGDTGGEPSGSGNDVTLHGILQVDTGVAVADGVDVHTVTATMYDASGYPVAGVPVSFAVDCGNATLSANAVLTDSSGVASVMVTSKVAGGVEISATANGVTLMNSPVVAIFTAGPADSTASTWVVTPTSSEPADGTSVFTGTATVADANGNPVIATTVTVDVPPGLLASVLTPTNDQITITTNVSGVATVKFTSTTAGSYQVGAYVGSPPEQIGSTARLVFVDTN